MDSNLYVSVNVNLFCQFMDNSFIMIQSNDIFYFPFRFLQHDGGKS